MINKLTKMISTFFYIGYFPIAAGSLASAIGVFIYKLVHSNLPGYFIFLAAVLILGFYSSPKTEKMLNEYDPSCIVIDEVAGMTIALFLLPITVPVLVTAFFVFRAFDMFKIYPVYVLEKRFSGFGIMLDDVIAGVYTNIAMHLAIYLSRAII